MHALRHFRCQRFTRFACRLVLTWFVVSLGVAAASPMVHSKAMERVCSSVGMSKFVERGHHDASMQDLGADMGAGDMDCPLCAIGGVPPPAEASHGAMPCPLGRALQSIPAARLAAATSAPPPARGPPARG